MKLCQTGDRYVELGGLQDGPPGIIEPGALAAWFPTEQAACAAALRAFEAYAAGRAGVLYWRRRPWIERTARGCTVRMRLAISDSQPMWDTLNQFIDAEIMEGSTCTPRW